jgi:hypothetical protein
VLPPPDHHVRGIGEFAVLESASREGMLWQCEHQAPLPCILQSYMNLSNTLLLASVAGQRLATWLQSLGGNDAVRAVSQSVMEPLGQLFPRPGEGLDLSQDTLAAQNCLIEHYAY